MRKSLAVTHMGRDRLTVETPMGVLQIYLTDLGNVINLRLEDANGERIPIYTVNDGRGENTTLEVDIHSAAS
jgi:hypothetical protein